MIYVGFFVLGFAIGAVSLAVYCVAKGGDDRE